MVRSYKKKRNNGLDYYEEGLVYFVCCNYRKLPKRAQDKLGAIIASVGGFDEAALFKLLCDVTSTVAGVAREYNVSEQKLISLRNEFYRRALRAIFKK